MKLKKTRKDIIESIKEVSSKKKNEMFEVDSKVQAVAAPSFVNALEMSAKNKQMVIDRMKDKEKEKKDLEAQTVERKENETPKTDVMKKMKMVEEFVSVSFKDKFTINENICTVKTTSRAELKTLIENARKNEVKYTIGRTNEGYEFKYAFEILNESKTQEKEPEAKPEEKKDKKLKESFLGNNTVNDVLGELVAPEQFKDMGVFDAKTDKTLYRGPALECPKELLNKQIDAMYIYSAEFNVSLEDEEGEDADYVPHLATSDLAPGQWLESKEKDKKSLKEDKPLQSSPYKALIGEHFDHSFEFEFLDIVAHALDRIDFDDIEDLDEAVSNSVNDTLTYTADQWTIAEFYASSPEDLDWMSVVEEFSNDISALAYKIVENKEEPKSEEDSEEIK